MQWSIVSRAFVDAPGDDGPSGNGDGSNGRRSCSSATPKQGIYAFRGADVRAYLQASRGVHQRHTLYQLAGGRGLLERAGRRRRLGPAGGPPLLLEAVSV